MKTSSLELALVSGLFAFVAAIFWGLSTAATAPPTGMIKTLLENDDGLTALDHYFKEVSTNNRIAAFFSGLAVLSGSISTMLAAL